MRYVKHLWVLLLLAAVARESKGQNFSYAPSADSSAYTELSSPVVLAGLSAWSGPYGFPIPFSFDFCGTSTDTIVIETNGFIILDKPHETAIIAFNSFTNHRDTTNAYGASISYLTTGSSGNRICKIQFKKLSQYQLSGNDHLSYQVWLYENGGKIECHIGPNSYSAMEEMFVPFGLINRYMDTTDKAYMLYGNPSSPSGQIITGEAELVYLNTVSHEGIILTLTPAF